MKRPVAVMPVLCAAWLAVGACSGEQMIVLPMTAKNPTNYEFGLPLVELRERVLAAFTVKHQIENPFSRNRTALA